MPTNGSARSQSMRSSHGCVGIRGSAAVEPLAHRAQAVGGVRCEAVRIVARHPCLPDLRAGIRPRRRSGCTTGQVLPLRIGQRSVQRERADSGDLLRGGRHRDQRIEHDANVRVADRAASRRLPVPSNSSKRGDHRARTPGSRQAPRRRTTRPVSCAGAPPASPFARRCWTRAARVPGRTVYGSGPGNAGARHRRVANVRPVLAHGGVEAGIDDAVVGQAQAARERLRGVRARERTRCACRSAPRTPSR